MGEETSLRPKPMIEIGGKPILWNIMKIYAQFGFTDFVVCLGYHGYVIKEYFLNYLAHNADFMIDLSRNEVLLDRRVAEPWRITLAETGQETLTGGRLKRVAPYLREEDDFFCTYGDGVANIDLAGLLAAHRKGGRVATVTAAAPAGRYGALDIGEGNLVSGFKEKPAGGDGWINAGFFVFSRQIFEYIEGDATSLETGVLQHLAGLDQLSAFRHDGFWHAVDTLRDKRRLDELCQSGVAPWLDFSGATDGV